MKAVFYFIILFIPLNIFAQTPCISNLLLEKQLQDANSQDASDEYTNLKFGQISTVKANNTLTIPVVFHIIHNGDVIGENENISDSIILAQLKRLNEDFSALNADSAAIPLEFKALFANTNITFQLAKKAPNGDFTSGINRYNFVESGWDEDSLNTFIKPQTIWNRNHYLNIWTAAFEGFLWSNQVNGYATPPLSSTPDTTDGIVLNYLKVGNDIPNNKGRTLVHEVGHWLGLFHIWGDDAGACTGDDGISDTPNQADSYFNCPSGVPNSCGSNDMYVNYMDYTDASCSLLFTHEQKAKMHQILTDFRDELNTSPALQGKDLIIRDIIFPEGTLCQQNFIPAVTIQNIGTDTIFNFSIDLFVDNVLLYNAREQDTLIPNESSNTYLSWFPFTVNDNLVHSIKYVIKALKWQNGIAVIDSTEFDLNNEYVSNFQAFNTGSGIKPNSFAFVENNSISPIYYIENPDNDLTWEVNNNLLFLNNYNNIAGRKDAIISTDFDLRDIGYIIFDYFFEYRENFDDTLTVSISYDCGINWMPIFEKSGLSLSNNIINNNEYLLPENKIPFIGELVRGEHLKKARIKFEVKSAAGNNFFLNSLSFSTPESIDNTKNELVIHWYPNPSNGNIIIQQIANENVHFFITDVTGVLIYENLLTEKETLLSLNFLSKGTYFIHFINEKTGLQKIDKLILME